MSVTITRTAWTDDDGSGTTGTVINNAVKTELYGQIDTALALLLPLAGGTMTGDLLFADATYDVGKSGATRPRNVFCSGTLTANSIGLGGAAANNNNMLVATGVANQFTAIFTGNGTSGQSYGVRINAGSTSADQVFHLSDKTAATDYLLMAGDGSATFTSSVSGIAWQYNQTHASTPSGIDINYTAAAPNGTGNLFARGRDTGATRFELRSNGGLANFSANNVNLSDADLKDIYSDAPSQREAFRRIQFVLARYKDAPDSPLDVMVTAQQLQPLYPDLITDFDGHRGVREHGLMMRAFKVIQELDAELLDLRARVDAQMTIH